MHKNIILFVIALCTSVSLSAQTGTLKGTVSDAQTGETIPFANIVLKSDGINVLGGASDLDGNYTIKPINPGQYNVEVSFIGYATVIQTNVLISPDKITFLDYNMSLESNVLNEVQIIEYDVPLIDADKSGSTKTAEQITSLPTRNVSNVAATTAGVYQEDSGGEINVRGSRSNATAYYVDGVKIVGDENVLPQSAIDQMTVVTGGLPAKYGDATGGIISIVTSGPSRVTRAGLEVSSSKFLDPYNHNLAAFNVSGPLLKRDEDRTPIMSYLISGEYTYQLDRDPSAVGMPELNEDVFSNLQQNPILFQGEPDYNYFQDFTYGLNAADYLTQDDWTMVDAKKNHSDRDLRLQGKFTFGITKDIDFIMGGNLKSNKYNSGSFSNQLINFDNNPTIKKQSYNYYASFKHRLSGDDGGAVKNLFYTLQADRSVFSEVYENPNHGKNYFLYNYVGKFTPSVDDTTFTFTDPFAWEAYNVYVLDENGNKIPLDENLDNLQDVDENGNLLWQQETQTGVILSQYETLDFDPSEANPILANYTQSYYDWYHSYIPDANPTFGHIQQNALMNGDPVPYINSLWLNIGDPYSYTLDLDETQNRFTGSASADIGDHAISFGFEYEKNEKRVYQVRTQNLWNIARQLANQHLNNPQYYVDDEVQWAFDEDVLILSTFYDVNEDSELYSTFGANIRDELGVSINDEVFVDGIDPENLSFDMFAADEILQGDYYNLYYYGYDHVGNEVHDAISFDEFLYDKDDNGDYTRKVGPFEPLYSAAYIQDKFSLDDIVFNVGLRIDRYDANQEVLKDKYSLYPTLKASEVDPALNPNSDLINPQHPLNIGDDFVVYANGITDQTMITGYRDGDTWYDAQGVEVTDPSVLSMGTGVIPFLQNPNHVQDENRGLTGEAFEDYTPAISVMPRISFNFPVSDEAMFFAHYDILTQRPPGSNRMNPFDYLFLEANTSQIQNPNLRPERTTDYEVGFTQALTKYSAFTVSAFYRELSDMIQSTRVSEAYPMSYVHYDNVDFGTVKGLSFGYDLRRRNNIQLTGTYTLQFADGTGSESTTTQQLVQDGQPNLKTTLPLDFDQRHNISLNIDYRYGSGSKYNGPTLFGSNVLSGFGANLLIAAGSGTPYSQQENILAEAQFGVNTRSTLKGDLNGSRKPWSFKADIRLNKNVAIQVSEDRSLQLDAYFMVENVFNTANIIEVYRYTGNADDDGYLSSAEGMQATSQAVDPTAFYDQYTLKVNDPNNYARPRLIKLGMKVNF